jgi:ABC-type transport system involved in multi-copper enzyme maturation permease subunit
MQARSFTMLFLCFQGVLALILLSAGAGASSDSAGSFASGVIFTMFAIAALFVQPMRGVNALSSEITGNTIEMMVLTRLSAWRIVFGKWIAIVSQTGLILITIIPYLILRYFFGGMVLLGELVFLALMFLTSMSFTAVMVGLSGNSTKFVRLLPILAFIFLMNVVPALLFRRGFNDFMSFCTLSDTDSILTVISYVCFVSYIGWCALSHGTSVIAPVAENHTTIRRLIALGLALVTAAIGFHGDAEPEVLAIIFAVILAPVVITSLTEPSILLPPMCKPFLQRGPLGRLSAFFLLPGWPAGVFYSGLMLLVSAAGLAIASSPVRQGDWMDPEVLIGGLACIGGVLLPALLAALFSKQESRRFTNFMVFLLVTVLFAVIPAILTSINDHERLLWLFVWDPLIFIPMLDMSEFSRPDLLTTVIAVVSIIFVILAIVAINAFRKYRDVIREAESQLASSPSAP